MKKLILLLTQLFCHHRYQYTEINHDGLNTMECKWCGKRKIVKVFPLLVLVFVMCGCVHVTDYGVVEQVERLESLKISTNYATKYRVRVSADFNENWNCNVYFYTNELYSVGDTIQITRRTNP